MAEKTSAVYKITNIVTGDFYIGSSKDVKHRWAAHKCKSTWNEHPNNPMYIDMQKYGKDKFELQILAEVESDKLKEAEQQFIELLKPTYNSNRANGWDIERYKEYQKEYKIEYYQQNRDKYKEHQIEYYQQNREKRKEYQNKYNNQTCFYNGQTLTLKALSCRFKRKGIPHPTKEAKKYLVI